MGVTGGISIGIAVIPVRGVYGVLWRKRRRLLLLWAGGCVMVWGGAVVVCAVTVGAGVAVVLIA